MTDIKGRAAYISDPARQEEILCHTATEPVMKDGWGPVAQYEKEHQKSAQKNNQGREIIVQLPNEWANLDPDTLISYAAQVAQAAIGREMPYTEMAVHWNHARTNLHLHVIFSERLLSQAPAKRYDRDIYHTPDGKVARRRADRARDAAGKELPPVHRKGELVSPAGFGPKLKDFKARDFPAQAKERAAAELQRLGVELEKQNPYFLHEYHEGKGSESEAISAKNARIRAYNACIAFFTRHEILSTQVLKTLYTAAQADLRANLPPRVHDELWTHPEARQKIRQMCQYVQKQYQDKRRWRSSPPRQQSRGLEEIIQQAQTASAQQNAARRSQRSRRGLDLER